MQQTINPVEELQGIASNVEARATPLNEPNPLKVHSGDLGEQGDPGPKLSLLDKLAAKADEAKALTSEPSLEDITKDIAQMEALIEEAKKDPYYGQDNNFTKSVDGYAAQIRPLQQFLVALRSMDNDPMKLAEAFGGGGLMSMNRAQRRAHQKKLRKAKNKR